LTVLVGRGEKTLKIEAKKSQLRFVSTLLQNQSILLDAPATKKMENQDNQMQKSDIKIFLGKSATYRRDLSHFAQTRTLERSDAPGVVVVREFRDTLMEVQFFKIVFIICVQSCTEFLGFDLKKECF
jgi:hypothetical protein